MAGEDRIKYWPCSPLPSRTVLQPFSPEISDAEFDALWDELKQLDPKNTVLHEVGPEPLLNIGRTYVSNALLDMELLTKILFISDPIYIWIKRYLAQPKLMAQHYLWSMLLEIFTEQQLEVVVKGEDVTLNAKLVANVPRLNLPVDCHAEKL